VRQTLLSAGACAPAVETAPGIVMARTIVAATLMESDDFVWKLFARLMGVTRQRRGGRRSILIRKHIVADVPRTMNHA
jgi:hypothetical protein